MAYTFSHSLSLGSSKSGITSDLRADLLDTSGNNVISGVSSLFVEIGNGNYLWTYGSFPDNFRGAVKFYQNSAPGVVLASLAINPEEGEYIDSKVSEITSSIQNEIDIEVSSEDDRINISTGVSSESITIIPGVD